MVENENTEKEHHKDSGAKTDITAVLRAVSWAVLFNASTIVELSVRYINHSFPYIKATSLTCRSLKIPRRRQSANSLILITERFLVLPVGVISIEVLRSKISTLREEL